MPYVSELNLICWLSFIATLKQNLKEKRKLLIIVKCISKDFMVVERRLWKIANWLSALLPGNHSDKRNFTTIETMVEQQQCWEQVINNNDIYFVEFPWERWLMWIPMTSRVGSRPYFECYVDRCLRNVTRTPEGGCSPQTLANGSRRWNVANRSPTFAWHNSAQPMHQTTRVRWTHVG